MTLPCLRSWLLCACIAASVLLGGCASNGLDSRNPSGPEADVYTVNVGDTEVRIVVYESETTDGTDEADTARGGLVAVDETSDTVVDPWGAAEDGAAEDGAAEEGATEDGAAEDGAAEQGAAADSAPGVGERPVARGDTATARGRTIIVLHDDENTASEAALLFVRENGGRLVELQHGGERNITFRLDGQQYTFDPNRMFTEEGARASLRNLGEFSDAALLEVQELARAFLEQAHVDSLDVVITAHNNTDNNYSTLSYDEGGIYEQDALFMYLGMPAETDDFYFVTDRRLYDRLRAEEVNVVLQDNAQVTNDGSLSVYAARIEVPYVNVEAQHGHFERQSHMLERLFAILAEVEE